MNSNVLKYALAVVIGLAAFAVLGWVAGVVVGLVAAAWVFVKSRKEPQHD